MPRSRYDRWHRPIKRVNQYGMPVGESLDQLVNPERYKHGQQQEKLIDRLFDSSDENKPVIKLQLILRQAIFNQRKP